MLCEQGRFALPGSPSPCILDTALVPLPSFILLAAIAVLVVLKQIPPPFTQTRNIQSRNHLPPRRWLHITYLVLVACAICMTILELVRLGLDEQGVGLLPVVTIALLVVFGLLWSERIGRTTLLAKILLAYWAAYAIFMAVKCARMHLLETLHPSLGSKYPSSDMFLDNVVMLGLYILFVAEEIWTLYGSRKAKPMKYDLQRGERPSDAEGFRLGTGAV